MDENRFDNLTRTLAAGASRRTILRALAGGVVAAVAAVARHDDGEAAKCGREGESCGCCKPGLTCTGGACCPDDRVCGGACCPAGYTCQGGTCVRAGKGNGSPGGCPTGQAPCNGGCVAITSDVTNCGACGYACPVSTDPCLFAVCAGGFCGFAATNEGGTCAGDGNRCFGGHVCQSGGCVGTNPITCAASDQCHVAGECNPADGLCSNPYADLGITCETGNLCTDDACDGQGACIVGTDVVTPNCPVPNQCQVSVSCNPANGHCDQIVNQNSSFPCGAGPSCADGMQHAQDACDGGGTCIPGANTSCGLFVCGTTSCRTTCGSDADCVGAAHCDGGVCMGDGANGAACDEASDCQSGFCNSVSAYCCGQNCAAGVDCTGPGFTCGVPPCGAVGQACCAGEVCNGGAHCDSGSCVANLANGQPCYENSDCQSGICNATSGICCGQSCGAGVACVGAGSTCDDPTCGGPGQACCAGNACDSGACSRNFRCEPCGDDWYQICCFDSHNVPHCNGGLFCPDGACWPAECGGPNEACCEGTRCQNGLFCDAGQVCRVPCGGNGQVCCAGGTCGGGLTCDGQVCRPCGTQNLPCCAGDVCGTGLECGASFSGNLTQCVSNCGGSGEICCREEGAAVCDAGLECNSHARCVADGCGGPGQECCYLRECDEGTVQH